MPKICRLLLGKEGREGGREGRMRVLWRERTEVESNAHTETTEEGTQKQITNMP